MLRCSPCALATFLSYLSSPPPCSLRYGKDVGRSVAAWGYWGDIVNSPYHAFGTVSEDGGLFKYSNKQFSRTAVDLAEHNILVSV